MKNISETDKAYIAGFLDGEGCITISKYKGKNNQTPSYCLRVMISQKEKITLESLKEITGTGRVCKNGGGAYIWIFAPFEAIELLREILPYLRNKSSEAIVAIEFQGKQGHKNSLGKGHSTPQYLITEKERYYRKLMELKRVDEIVEVEEQKPNWKNINLIFPT